MKDMAIVGIAGEGFCTDHQAVLVRDRNAGFNAELVRLARLALADTFDFRGMQCVEFVFVFRLLLVNPLYSLQQRVQMLERCGALQFCRRQFPLDLSQHDTKDRALAFNGFAHAAKLLGMGITTGFAAQFLAFLGVTLLQGDAASFGRLYDFAACNFQQATIHRMRNRFCCLQQLSTPDSPIAVRKRPI